MAQKQLIISDVPLSFTTYCVPYSIAYANSIPYFI